MCISAQWNGCAENLLPSGWTLARVAHPIEPRITNKLAARCYTEKRGILYCGACAAFAIAHSRIRVARVRASVSGTGGHGVRTIFTRRATRAAGVDAQI
jgi:hypothetical protein